MWTIVFGCEARRATTWIVSDALLDRVGPLLPPGKSDPDIPGRRRLDDRRVLCGILFVLPTGIQRSSRPRSWGSGPG